MSAIQVLIVDDMPSYRETVRTGLEDYPDDVMVVGEAADGEGAIRLTKALRPDVVLLDIRMRGMDGLMALPHLRQAHPECCIILLTSHSERMLVFKGLQLGAVSYVLKECGGAELLRAITSAYHHESYFSPPIATMMREKVLAEMAQSAAPQNSETTLSEQEIDILRGIARGQRDKDIAKHLALSEATISKYVLRIIEKLRAENRSHAVALAKDQRII